MLQELRQGLLGARQHERIVVAFEPLPLVIPDRDGHVRAAGLSDCRRRGVEVATIDVTTDRDFEGIAAHHDLDLWEPTESSHPDG